MNEKRMARDEQATAMEREVDDDDDDEEYLRPQRKKGSLSIGGKPIKWKFVAFLVLLTGTAVLPAALWVVDNVFSLSGSALAVSASALAGRMGFTPTPKNRLLKFYEKHNPEKVPEVPQLIHKYAGNYPKMIKVLEAKYHDYGFFIGWRDDADFKHFIKQESTRAFRKAQLYYRKYVPFKLRVAFYNMYANTERLLGPPLYVLDDLLFGKVLGWGPILPKGPSAPHASSSSSRRGSRGRSSSSSARSASGSSKKSSSRSRPSSTRRSSGTA